jgi:hypothetical protein
VLIRYFEKPEDPLTRESKPKGIRCALAAAKALPAKTYCSFSPTCGRLSSSVLLAIRSLTSRDLFARVHQLIITANCITDIYCTTSTVGLSIAE